MGTGGALDATFATLEPGPIPDGPADGTVLDSRVSWLVRRFAWQGKVFDAERGVLVNQVGPFGTRAIVATVYYGPSLFDQRPCIVIDYSGSWVARMVRDEIRLWRPGLYLGKVYLRGWPAMHFALELVKP